MLHPIGSHAPAVYWRRRVALFGGLGVLLVVTVLVLRPGADRNNAAATTPLTSHARASTSTHAHPSATSTHPVTASKAGRSGSPSAAPRPCSAAALKVAAVVDHPTYRVGDKPVVLLQVTNPGPRPCVQDLADTQIELRVYNGESRVWGSHDCTIQPGVADRTLAVGQPVRVSIVWSGLSSQPKCAGTRQRVGAGTYTLYALLSGREGTAAQFSVS